MQLMLFFAGEISRNRGITLCIGLQKSLTEIPEGVALEVDGGIKAESVGLAAAAGANVIVAGTAILRAEDPAQVIRGLRRRAADCHPSAEKALEVKGQRP